MMILNSYFVQDSINNVHDMYEECNRSFMDDINNIIKRNTKESCMTENQISSATSYSNDDTGDADDTEVEGDDNSTVLL